MHKELNEYLNLPSINATASAPLIFDLKKEEDNNNLLTLYKANNIRHTIDNLSEQKKELSEILDPTLITHQSITGQTILNKTSAEEGVWVYFPWSGTLIHTLEPELYKKIRVSRNLNLITPAEQAKVGAAIVGFAGLNVGNPAAVCCALTGFSKFKLADFDTLSATNLNRFRSGLDKIGVNKAVLTAQQIYDINPFADIKLFDKGIEQGKEEEFLLDPRIDVLVEEMDNLKLKIKIREAARSNGIPVVMVTGNGPNLILDVERFDKKKNLPLLNSHLKKSVIDRIQAIKPGLGTFKERVLLARDFMGAENLTPRLAKSFLLVGKKLAGIPQLAEASFLRGAVLGYVIRQIVTNEPMRSKRYFVNLDKIK